MLDAVTPWSEKYPDVEVQFEPLARNGYEEYPQLLTRIAGGNAPDVIRVLNFQPTQLVSEGDALLPLDDYEFTSPFGVRWGVLHAGIDLAAAEGTPYKAVHAGLVTKAGYNGGYGYSITIQNSDGTEVVQIVHKGDGS